MAWREKIGLVSFILLVMGFVGFLTFGFTQTVCPTPPTTVHGSVINSGYVVIHGWAYMLADWNNHPPVPGQTSEPTNVLYPPVNAGGMDASFLFQEIHPKACANVLVRKHTSSSSMSITGSQVYFPCCMFNPNDTTPVTLSVGPTSGCHLSQSAREMYRQLQTQGVPKSNGKGYAKAARVYYDWHNINTTDHLMVYNG